MMQTVKQDTPRLPTITQVPLALHFRNHETSECIDFVCHCEEKNTEWIAIPFLRLDCHSRS